MPDTFKTRMQAASRANRSVICVGLDFDTDSIPAKIRDGDFPIFDFNQGIIEATKDLVCAYKPNMAFYERHGESGWNMLRKTIEIVPGDIPVILDGKRGDIGSSARKYAESYFEDLDVDAITINPYMGTDAMEPFVNYEDRGIFILCRTTNKGAEDFQDALIDGVPLYEMVARMAVEMNKLHDNVGLVGPATLPTRLKSIRHIVGPDMPILAPGVGAQGGHVHDAVQAGANIRGEMLLLSASRSIIYASKEEDWTDAARQATMRLRDQANDARNVSVTP